MESIVLGLGELSVWEGRNDLCLREHLGLPWRHIQTQLKKYLHYTQREHRLWTIPKSIVQVGIVGLLFCGSTNELHASRRGETNSFLTPLFVVTPPVRFFSPHSAVGRREENILRRPDPHLWAVYLEANYLSFPGPLDFSLRKWDLYTSSWSLRPQVDMCDLPLGSLWPRSPPIRADKNYETILTYPNAG